MWGVRYGKGYKVAINYLTDRENAKELSNYLKQEYKIETMVIKADVSDEKQVKNMIQEIINKFGRIDVLVNNAGIAIDKEFEDRTVEDWKRTLEVNTIGTKEFVIKNEIANDIEIKVGRLGKTYFFIKDPDGILVEIIENS